MGTLKEDLIAAKTRIADPKKWASGDTEVDGRDCAITACSPLHAARACAAYDALWDALPDEWKGNERHNLEDVFRFNDNPETTHTDVMRLFDRAIEAAE